MNRAAVFALVAIVIHVLVRASKDPRAPLTLRLPPAWRPVLALALGLAAGVVDALARGATWQEALVSVGAGLLSGGGAIVGHELGIESARGGREIGAPKEGS